MTLIKLPEDPCLLCGKMTSTETCARCLMARASLTDRMATVLERCKAREYFDAAAALLDRRVKNMRQWLAEHPDHPAASATEDIVADFEEIRARAKELAHGAEDPVPGAGLDGRSDQSHGPGRAARVHGEPRD